MQLVATRPIITTPYSPTPEHEARAKEWAIKLQGEYVPRRQSSLARLRLRHPGRPLVVIHRNGLEWHREEGQEPLFFHPNMSFLRAQRIAAGGRDAMLEAAGFEPGDSVLDCTAGLASDAIIFSFAGGIETNVTAVESEEPIYHVVSHGLQMYQSGWEEFDQALRRIEVVLGDHLEVLRSMSDRSQDIVYFDPMFRDGIEKSAALSPLRSFANARALLEEAVEQAKRVARKAVLMKERGRSGEWERLGFTLVSNPQSNVAYGVITI